MERGIEYSAPIGDEVRTTTCYMCACRCGIRVHLKDGEVRYIEGNPDHPVNRGVLCAKGSAGIMQHYSPARLSRPLLRTGERGRGEFREISWEDAIGLAVEWLRPLRETDPRKLAFFTGRDQSQALTGWWASRFGTPNHAAHGGFCSVNMAAAGLYSIGASFWEFGEPDWEHASWFMMLGVAEDHDSNPIKLGLARLKERGAKVVSVNPVRTGYSAIADEWIGITPGTDGLLVLSLAHELLRSGKVDAGYLASYTNAPWLVVEAPGDARDGLFARDAEGRPIVWDRTRNAPRSVPDPEARPALRGRYELPDGTAARPAFELLARRCLDPRYAPEAVAAATGVPAATIRRLAAEIAQAAFAETVTLDIPWTDVHGRRHETMVGRPVAFHAMRGISAHSNGFQTCRALHVLQMLLGTVDVPGGFRYKAPFPKPAPPPQLPTGRPDQVEAGQPMPGPPLGFPRGPEDLLVDGEGRPNRIDKAFSWEAPIAAHGMMHTVIHNAWAGDPYPIDTLFLYMANMAWNSAMNTAETAAMLTDRDPATGEYRIPPVHLQRCVRLRDGGLRGPRAPGHDLPRALGLHLDAGPADRFGGGSGRLHPPAGGGAPTGTCARSRTCSSRSGPASGCRVSSMTTGRPATRAATPTSSPTTNTGPGLAPLRAGAARPARRTAPGSRTPTSSPATSRTAASGRTSSSPPSGTSSTSTATTSPTRNAWASLVPRTRYTCSFTASRSSASGSPRVGTVRYSRPRSTAPGSSGTSTRFRTGTSPSGRWTEVGRTSRGPSARPARGLPRTGAGRSTR